MAAPAAMGRQIAPKTMGNAIFPPVPQIHKAGTQYTEAQIFWVAKHGIRRTGMFANGNWSKDKELWKIAAYLKRMNNLSPSVRAAIEQKAPAASP
jgi:hypothetical protein